MSSPDAIDADAVRRAFTSLQDQIAEGLRRSDPEARFREDTWTRPEGGGGIARVFDQGPLWEKAGVNFSDVTGARLPPSATATRPQLAGVGFRAMGVSLVFHPRSPMVPTTHLNVRFFTTLTENPVWWFGGGFDLTPYYPFVEDAVRWHRAAEAACAPFGPDLYAEGKATCDSYFFLPHRGETRGVGGLFFDDFNRLGFAQSFAFIRSLGDAFWPAYAEILQRRRHLAYGEAERRFQQYRRGRYVEFNLLYDRGTLFGLQSKGRTESILMSLPPTVAWEYDWQPAEDSPEAALPRDFLRPRDWLAEAD